MSEHSQSPSHPGPNQWFNLIDLFTFGLCSVKQRDFLARTASIVLEFLYFPVIGPGHILPYSNCYLGMHSWDSTGLVAHTDCLQFQQVSLSGDRPLCLILEW